MPRPSSPLDAKASFRSPYALDRSQQNSCPAYDVRHPLGEDAKRWSCALYLSDNDVFKVRPQSTDPNLQGETWGAGQTLASRCHFATKPGLHEERQAAANLYLSIDRFQPCFAKASQDNLAARGWWSQTGSNRRPDACKAPALPTELWPHKSCPGELVGHDCQGW